MEENKTYNVDIQQYLPHREPMLMVDSILEIGNEEVITTFKIKGDNVFIENEKFSEVGLIENMAQTSSATFGHTFFESENKKVKVIGFITNIKSVKIHNTPKIGEEIISKAKLVSRFENICHISCQSFVENQMITEAEINLFIKEIEE